MFEGGKVWLSGSKGAIYQSLDYGESWNTLPKVFKREKEAYYRKPDIYSFHYINDTCAIATNRSNHLMITSTNFNSSKRIPSPLDQGLFEKKYKSYYLNGNGRKYVNNWKIDKVRIFGNYYVIMQNGIFYYTSKDEIQWNKLNEKVIDFETDEKSGKLYIINHDFELKEADSEFGLHWINKIPLSENPIDIKVYNDVVYLLVPNYISKKAKDKVRNKYGNFTVVEKNYRKLEKYILYAVTKTVIEQNQTIAQ